MPKLPCRCGGQKTNWIDLKHFDELLPGSVVSMVNASFDDNLSGTYLRLKQKEIVAKLFAIMAKSNRESLAPRV